MNRFTRIVRALSPNCKDATRLQSEALDRSLPLLQRIGLRIHLFLCIWCRRYGQQIRFLRVASKRCEHDHFEVPVKTLSPDARERIKQALESAKK